MTKTIIWHVISAVLLAVFIEFYIWSQSGTLAWDSNWTKAVLICSYFFLAIGAQCVFSYLVGYNAAEAAIMNAMVSAVVAAWLTISAFAFHPGLAKDEEIQLLSLLKVFGQFFLTIGLATFLTRFLTAIVIRKGKRGQPELR